MSLPGGPCLQAESPGAPGVPEMPPLVTGSAAPSHLAAAPGAPIIEAARLLALLPEPPAGWGADKPEGSTSDSTGFPITTVNRIYYKGDADDAPTVSIEIIDSANNRQFQDATKALWSATGQTPEGYDKDVKVGGLPGFEHYTNATQTGVLWVAAAGRFFVQVEMTKQPATELQGWMARIDLKKLSGLK